MSKESSAQLVIFDGDCGFCTTCANWARRRLPSSVEVVAWQNLDDLSQYGLTVAEVISAAYFVQPSGRMWRGSSAVARTFRVIGGFWGTVGRVFEMPGVRQLASVGYAVVSSYRQHLPGGTPACKLPTADVARANPAGAKKLLRDDDGGGSD